MEGIVTIYISSDSEGTFGVPKQVQLFDSKLNLVTNKWFKNDFFQINNLEKGHYLLKVSFPSRVEEQYIDVTEGEQNVNFYDITQHLFFDNTSDIRNKPFVMRSPKSERKKKDKKLHREGKHFSGLFEYWISYDEGAGWYLEDYFSIDRKRFVNEQLFRIKTPKSNCALIAYPIGDDITFINLPPATEVQVAVRDASSRKAEKFALNISIATNNWVADILLKQLVNGSIKYSESLADAEAAEHFLFEKRENCSRAAVGGYFLLRANQLGRMHDWASNLSKWFPWMADGAIIYAWQLIQTSKDNASISEVREYLLEAVKRGLPIYSEGFRLLVEGLNQLSSLYNKMDDEVEQGLKALNIIKRHIDWSSGHLAFTLPKKLAETLALGGFIPTFSQNI